MDLICAENISPCRVDPAEEMDGEQGCSWPTAATELQDGGNDEALEHFTAQEERFLPREGYLELLHTSMVFDIDMRERMVDLILKTRDDFEFSMMTASMAVSYMDRFFSTFEISWDKKWVVELATTACVSIAAKMEEVKTYTLTALQEHTETVFEAATVGRMERLVLDVLQWELNAVTPVSYVDRFLLACGYGGDTGGCSRGKGWAIREQAMDLIRSSFSEVEAMRFPPSTLAAACVLHSIEEHGGGAEGSLGGIMKVLLRTTRTHPRVLRDAVRMVERSLCSSRSLSSPVTVLPAP